MKRFFLFAIIVLSYSPGLTQQYLNHQLRLEPVWTRVADALGELGSVESVKFSPNGKYIVSGTKYDNYVIMWRTSDGHELWRQYAKEEIERVGWSSDNKYVAAASEDYLVTIYDSKSGSIFKELKHSKGIDGLIWSKSGLLLVTGEEELDNPDGTKDGRIRVFDIGEDKEIKNLNFGETVNELFFTLDDKYLLVVGHGWIKIYDTADWSLAQTLMPDDVSGFTSGMFSPDGKYVIAVGQTKGVKGNVYLWEWRTGKLLRMFNHTGKKIESITWHPNGEYVAYAGHDPHIFVYRVKDIIKYKKPLNN